MCLFIRREQRSRSDQAKLRNALALDYPAGAPGHRGCVGRLDRRNQRHRPAFAPRVRLLAFSPRRGKIAAINEGMRSVTSDIVVFSDANTFLEPEAIRALVRNFADPQVGAVSGDVALVGERADARRDPRTSTTSTSAGCSRRSRTSAR